MPRVPSVGLSPTSRPQFQAPGVVSYQGNPLLQQAAQTGARMQKIGQVVGQIGIQVEDKINDARAMEFTNTFEHGVNKLFQEYQQTKGKNGIDGLADFQKSVQELYDGSSPMLMNDAQRTLSKPIVDRIRNRADLNAQGHYNKAAAEYKQEQVVVERLKLVDALRSEPLSENSVALFMRLRQNLAKEADGLGYSDERSDAHVLEGTSALINDLFNHYADSDRPEDALAFLQAVEVFEQSPVAATQGPASLRGKTYAEAQAAAEAGKQPFGAVMFDATRVGLKRKAEKISLDSWAVKTVDGYSSASDAFEDAEAKFANGEWSESERVAFEKRAATVFDRARTLRNIEASDALEEAKNEWMKNGKISEATQDSLRSLHKLDDFAGWAGRASNGKASNEGDALVWGAYQAAYDNPTGIANIASTIKDREGLISVYKQALEKGATVSEAANWAKKVAEESQYGGQKDVEEELQGLSTPTDVEQYATDWFGSQWGDVIEKSKIGGSKKDQDRAAATLALKSDRTREFKQAFDKKVRDLRRLDTGLNNEQLLERARAEAWQDGLRTYEVDGQTRKINIWTALPSEIKAAEIASSPAGTLKSLEAYAAAPRIVGEPGDPKRKDTILDEAVLRFNKENMSADMVLEYRDRRRQLSQSNQAALRMMGLATPMVRAMGVTSAMQAYPVLPETSALEIDSAAGRFRLLQIAQQIQMEDTASLEAPERQAQLKRELWSAINSDVENDGWLTSAIEKSGRGRGGMSPGRVFYLEQRYLDKAGPTRLEWETRGMTEESFMEVLNLHPTIAKARSPGVIAKSYWTPQPYPEEGQAPQAVEAGR